MADVHFFDARIAQKYGVNCAVILQNIWHWVQKNEANGVNFYDGDYWTYNSTKAFSVLFPYLSAKQIETALKKLREEGIIKTGNYNAVKYDRTLWYAITKKGKSILHFDGMETDKTSNGNCGNVRPIPNINTDINTDVNTDIKTTGASSKPTPEEVFNFYHKNKLEVSPERFWKLNNKKKWKNGLSKNWKKAYLEMTGTPEESYNPYLEFNAEHYGKYMGE